MGCLFIAFTILLDTCIVLAIITDFGYTFVIYIYYLGCRDSGKDCRVLRLDDDSGLRKGEGRKIWLDGKMYGTSTSTDNL